MSSLSVSYLDLSPHLTTISRQKIWFPLFYHLSYNYQPYFFKCLSLSQDQKLYLIVAYTIPHLHSIWYKEFKYLFVEFS